MQQKLLSYMKKMLAVMLSLIASLFPFCGDGDGELITARPEANTVTAYNAAEDVADYIDMHHFLPGRLELYCCNSDTFYA